MRLIEKIHMWASFVALLTVYCYSWLEEGEYLQHIFAHSTIGGQSHIGLGQSSNCGTVIILPLYAQLKYKYKITSSPLPFNNENKTLVKQLQNNIENKRIWESLYL